MKSAGIMHFLERYLPVLLILFVILLCFSSWLSNYAVIGSDTYWHLMKIEHLSDTFQSHPFCIVDWYDSYFAGCFFIHACYPPVYYYIGVLLNMVSGDAFIAYKLLNLLSVILSGLGAYFLTLKLIEPKKGAHLPSCVGAISAAVMYSLSPFLLREITLGEAALVLAWGLAPWTIWAFVKLYLKPSLRNVGLLSFLVAALFLTHHHFLYFTLVSAFTYLFIRFIVERKYSYIVVLFPKIVLGCLLAIALASYWMLPYALESTSLETLASSAERSARNVANISSFLNRDYAWAGAYVGVSVVLIIILGTFLSFVKRRKVLIAPLGAALFSIAVACYYPIFENLPLSSTATFPIRAFVSISIFLSVAAGLSITELAKTINNLSLARLGNSKIIKNYIKPAIFLVMLVSIVSVIVWDFSPAIRYASGRTYSKEEARIHGGENFVSVIEYLQNQPGDGRVLVLPSAYGLAGSYAFYLPSITGKPIFDGTGGIPSRRRSDYNTMAYMASTNMSFNLNWVVEKIEEYNIEYVLISKRNTNTNLVSALRSVERFTVSLDNNDYLILKNNNPSGLIQVVDEPLCLLIGNYAYTRDILYSVPGIKLVVGESSNINDYTSEYLSNFDTIVCYGFTAKNTHPLEEYVENGGNLIIDLDGSNIDNLLGVTAHDVTFHDDATITSSHYPINFSNLFPNGSSYTPWLGTCYDGLDESFVKINENYDVIGLKTYGSGEALFIGSNLFYYTAALSSAETKSMIEHHIQSFIPTQSSETQTSITSSTIKFSSLEKIFECKVSDTTHIFISLTYNPHWTCLVDSEETEVINCEDLYIIELPEGIHTITLKIAPTLLDWASLTVSIVAAVISTLLILNRHDYLNPKKLLSRTQH